MLNDLRIGARLLIKDRGFTIAAVLVLGLGIAGVREESMNVSDERIAAERSRGAYVSAHAFALLGRQPLIGRDFRPDDERVGAASVVILGHTLWRTRYRSDAGIVGRTIRVNGMSSTVIGVMPDAFEFP